MTTPGESSATATDDPADWSAPEGPSAAERAASADSAEPAPQAQARRTFLGFGPVVVVTALAVVGVIGNWLQKYPCHDGNYGDGRAVRFACYTDVIALHSGHGLGEGRIPYVDHPVEYPVLIGALEGAVGLSIFRLNESGVLPAIYGFLGRDRVDQGILYYDIMTLIFAVCAAVSAWAVVRLRPHRPWDGVMVAVAPAVFLYATVNFDFVPVALTSAFLLAWARGRPQLAGVLLGLAAAAKFYPLVILGPLVLLAIRRWRDRAARRAATETVVMALATWVACNLPAAVVAPSGWWTFFKFSSERGVDWGSFWYIGDHLPLLEGPADRFFAHLVVTPDTLNTVAYLFFALCCLGIVALVRWAPRPPRLAALAFLVVAAFLLTNKVWSGQFVLWLIPLAVLARPRWYLFLVWQAAEVMYFLSFYQVQWKGGAVEFALVQAAVLRWGTVALLCGAVVHDILRPGKDVVRPADGSDPDAGPFAEPAEPAAPAPEGPDAGGRASPAVGAAQA